MNPWVRILIGAAAAASLTAVVEWRVAPIAFVLVLLTFSPLARRKRLWFVGDVETEYSMISRRREEALRQLKDLEDDRLSGKLPQSDYELQRPSYLQAAKELTARLDEIQQRRAIARARIEADLDKAKSQAEQAGGNTE
jgi:hypothetical protein